MRPWRVSCGRITGKANNEYLKELAQAEGMENPTREQLAAGPEAEKEGIQSGMEEPQGPGCANHEDERWTHASGAQSRACRGSDDGSTVGDDAGTRRPRRYHHDPPDVGCGADGGARSQ